MHGSRLVRFLTITAFCVLSTLPGAASAGSRWVFFGDSLSDPGNHFLLFPTQIAIAPFPPVPSAPYLIGGLHWSNGWTWAEHFALRVGKPLSGGPAVLAGQVFSNYAVGRARARANGNTTDFDLSAQVALFLEDHRGKAANENWYVIWIGANDLTDALQALQVGGPPAAGVVVGEALAAEGAEINHLHASGARKFLILNIPDLGKTPLLRGGPAELAATQLTAAFNAGLANLVQGLGTAHPDSRLLAFDVAALLAETLADPAKFGFDDVEHPCLSFGVVQGSVCADPNRHLFWDTFHPTTAAHRNIARAVASFLEQQH